MEIQKKITQMNRTKATNRNIKYIVIHYVGAVSSAKNNVDYYASKKLSASAHYFVDDNSIWQCVEDKDIAWHCGGATKYYHPECRNANSIGIEMCCKKDENWYITDATIKNTQDLVKFLMQKYSIKNENIIRHYDVTHKICPEPFVRDISKWNKFKEGLEVEITDLKEALDLLESTGRMTNRRYWEMAIQTTRNQDFQIIKWANDVRKLMKYENA